MDFFLSLFPEETEKAQSRLKIGGKSWLHYWHCSLSDFIALRFARFGDNPFLEEGMMIFAFLLERQKNILLILSKEYKEGKMAIEKILFTGNVTEIHIQDIEVINPRQRDKELFEEIVESIGRVGLLKPILINSRYLEEKGDI